MTQITRVITTLVAVVMLLSTTTPTYAAAASYENIATANCATETVEEFIDDASDTFTKLVEHIRWLRFDAYIRELLAKIKQEKNENVPTEPETPESEPEMPFEPVNPDNKVEGEEKEDLWIYPEEIIDVFEEELGYRPEYSVDRWYTGHYDLAVSFDHIEVCFGWEINTNPEVYDGWRIEREEFELNLEEIRSIYLTPYIDTSNGTYYSTDDVAFLFEEHYGYDVQVYAKRYRTSKKYGGKMIIRDNYNGDEFWLEAISTRDGWQISEESWLSFVEKHDLAEEVRYATSDIEYWTLDEIKEKLEQERGETPDIFVTTEGSYKDKYPLKSFAIEFECIPTCWIEYLCYNSEEGLVVTDKVFNTFLEENPKLIQSKEENVWVYPEDLMDAFESRIGYRPECQEVREPDGWSLEITLGSSEWTWHAKKSDYDGWRIEENEFEETFNMIIEDYFERVVDADSGEFLSTDEVEDLFEEHYGYEIDVYVCTYHTPEGVTADFVVCDRINGREIEIDAVETTKGWLIPEENWEWFIRNYDLEDESDYATSNIGWWDLDEILEEFQYMLGYMPEVEIWQDPGLDWYQTLDFTFEHLGGKEYSIEWLFLNGKGEPMVSDKVFERFLEENPEITYVLKVDEDELERMYAFYKARLENE